MRKTIGDPQWKDALKLKLKHKFWFAQPLVDLLRPTPQPMSVKPPRHHIMPQWRTAKLPFSVGRAQTMLTRAEQKLLLTLARDHFRNEGVIVDAGCFLGGSTLPLAHGISENKAVSCRTDEPYIHSYDLFTVEPWTIGLYFSHRMPNGSSFKDVFLENVRAFDSLIEVHPGDLTKSAVPDRPIEILFIDLAKHWVVNDDLVHRFFPKLIPGHSIVVQQDYLFNSWCGWLAVTMEYFSEYFEIVDHTTFGSVAFFYHTEIPPDLLKENLIADLSRREITELGARAKARFSGQQKEILTAALDHFERVMEQENWQ